MESLPEQRFCARGEQCSQYEFLDSPAKLGRYNNGELCEPCQQQDNGSSNTRTKERETRQKAQAQDGHRRLESKSGGQILQRKRDLIADLATEKESFFDAVSDVRRRWRIEPIRALPEPTPNLPLPPNELDRVIPQCEMPIPEVQENTPEWTEFVYAWRQELRPIIIEEVPDRFRYENLFHYWERFISACILYDPPTEELSQFADFAQPGDQGLGVLEELAAQQEDLHYKIPLMTAPPIRTLRDPFEEAQIESSYWQSVITRVGERHFWALGIDLWDVVLDVIRSDDELAKERNLRRHQNRPRYYIDIDEFTAEEDVRSAFRQIRATQPQRPTGRSKRDRLTCIQCAILHDRQGWTYEHLVEVHGWPEYTTSSKYISAGREFLK